MKEYSIKAKLMGSAFELAVVEDNERQANEWLDLGIREIQRIENLLSEYLPDSDTSKINKFAGKSPLAISKETFDLIARSLAISQLSKGCFDISVAPLKHLYHFKNTEFELPSSSQIKTTLQNIGYEKITLDNAKCSVFFENPSMRISFSAIGKGYASDQVKKLWLQAGVRAGFINASGDLNAFGTKADGTAWKIGIANPDDTSKIILAIPIQNASVATSGDYEQFFMHQGKRYSHNIHPHTGLPMTGIKSVTVFSPSAELSDALATATYVMGMPNGIDFINQLPQTHAIMIDDRNDILFSKHLQYDTVEI